MRIELVQVRKEEKEVLRNLLEKYDYEFSQYDLRDVNALGLYGYDWLDCYWTEERRWPFFIKVDGQLAGFVMVNDYPETDEPCDYCLSEFSCCISTAARVWKALRQGPFGTGSMEAGSKAAPEKFAVGAFLAKGRFFVYEWKLSTREGVSRY